MNNKVIIKKNKYLLGSKIDPKSSRVQIFNSLDSDFVSTNLYFG